MFRVSFGSEANLISVSSPDPRNNSHPLLEERINYMDFGKFQSFGDTKLISKSAKMANMVIKPIYLVDIGDDYYFYTYFSDRRLYNRYLKSSGGQQANLSLTFGGKSIRIKEIVNISTEDAFGVYRMFKFDKYGDFKISKLSAFIAKPKSSGESSEFYFSKK